MIMWSDDTFWNAWAEEHADTEMKERLRPEHTKGCANSESKCAMNAEKQNHSLCVGSWRSSDTQKKPRLDCVSVGRCVLCGKEGKECVCMRSTQKKKAWDAWRHQQAPAISHQHEMYRLGKRPSGTFSGDKNG